MFMCICIYIHVMYIVHVCPCICAKLALRCVGQEGKRGRGKLRAGRERGGGGNLLADIHI